MAMAVDEERKSENTQMEPELFVIHTPCECEATGMAESAVANTQSEHEANWIEYELLRLILKCIYLIK
jgi:hypothetical protein